MSNSWGGAEESVYDLAKMLNKKYFDVNLFINDFLYGRYGCIEGINVFNLGSLESSKKLQKICTICKIQSRLFKAIKKTGVELVHANLENSLLVLNANLRKLRIPVIFTLRGEETRIYHLRKTLEHKLIHVFLKKMIKDEKTTVTAVSNWLVRDFSNELKSRVLVIHSGVDCHEFKPLKTERRKDTILYVGRLIKSKGIDDLVEVAKELPEYEFLFAGSGPLSKIINLSNTKYLGFKRRGEVIKLYSQAGICAFPSYAEGMPNVGLEAMACGRAVVATYPGFSEYVESGKDGVLIEPGNRRQLKESIVTLMENSQLREIVEVNARKKALSYSLNKSIVKHQDLYKKVVKK